VVLSTCGQKTKQTTTTKIPTHALCSSVYAKMLSVSEYTVVFKLYASQAVVGFPQLWAPWNHIPYTVDKGLLYFVITV
jgi:hypothetical protein